MRVTLPGSRPRGGRWGLILAVTTLPLLLAGCCDSLFGPRGPAPPSRRPITIPVAQPPAQATPNISLFVEVSPDGLTVGSPMAVLTPEDGNEGPTLPCLEPGCPSVDSYDYAGLTELLGKVKLEYPDERQLLVRAHEDIDYEVVVRVLDASRSQGDRELFPEVALQVQLPGPRNGTPLTDPSAAGSSGSR